MEFGDQWGQSIAMFENLRAVHEPYNHQRRIVGFDTFTGYPEVGEKDIRSDIIGEGVYKMNAGYEAYLEELIDLHEKEHVMGHIKKHEIVKGGARSVAGMVHPESSRVRITSRVRCGSLRTDSGRIGSDQASLDQRLVTAFDEMNHEDYPGETEAAMEVLGLNDFRIENSQTLPDRVLFTKIRVATAWGAEFGTAVVAAAQNRLRSF